MWLTKIDGVGIARDALKDIIIHLQGQVIMNLQVQWQQDVNADFDALQDVSDTTQDQAVMVLLQLQQRIITAGPMTRLKPPPLFAHSSPLGMRNLAEALPHPDSPAHSSSPVSITKFPPPPPPPAYRPPDTPPESDRSPTAQSSAPLEEAWPENKGHLAKMGIFRRACKADPAAKHVVPFPAGSNRTVLDAAENDDKATPIPESKYQPDHVVQTPLQLTRFRSVSTASSGVFGTEPKSPEFHPWKFSNANSCSPRSRQSGSSGSHYSRTPSGSLDGTPLKPSSPPVSLNVKDLLPAEANQYAGFCKGAWRLQIGDYKKAMMQRQRPGGLYSTTAYWQCCKCRFEGRLVHDQNKQARYDSRVMVADGVQFRWVFLFKSHVKSRDDMMDPMQASYGCIFCCAEGRGTPTFGGVRSLMAHLQEHRERLPRGEVLYRMNCLVGRRAGPDDDFDINLIGQTMEDL